MDSKLVLPKMIISDNLIEDPYDYRSLDLVRGSAMAITHIKKDQKDYSTWIRSLIT